MTEYRIDTIHVKDNKVYYDIWVFNDGTLINFKKQVGHNELLKYGKKLESNFIAEYIYDLSECTTA